MVSRKTGFSHCQLLTVNFRPLVMCSIQFLKFSLTEALLIRKCEALPISIDLKKIWTNLSRIASVHHAGSPGQGQPCHCMMVSWRLVKRS